MKKTLLVLLIIIVVSVLLGGTWVATNNTYQKLSNRYEAKITDNEVIYDNMWKVIKQSAEVTDKYSGDFKDIFTGIMSGRYDSGGGQMMKWITEANPNFSDNMYSKLQNTIESKRTEWTMNQRMLIDLHREMTDMKTTIPSKWFLGSKSLPDEPLTITSSKTKETFESGEENEVNVF